MLLTTENYPDVLEPAWAHSKATFPFFFVFMYIGVVFLTSVLLALTVTFYLEYTEAQVKTERKKEWKGLIKAFAMVDTDGTCVCVNVSIHMDVCLLECTVNQTFHHIPLSVDSADNIIIIAT